MTNYWGDNKELCRGIPWIEIMERCGFRFISRQKTPGFGSEPTTTWVSDFAEGRFLATTGREGETASLHDRELSRTSTMQKQEIITEFLAKGDPERAHMMIKSWYSTVEDEVAKYLPGGVRQNPDFKIDLTEDLASDPTIKALIAEKLSRVLIEEEVDRVLRAIEHSSEEGLANSWSLDDFLEREFEETGFIVDRLMKYGANVHLVAAAKTGKTNAIINLTKALADGGHFLGVFETKPIKGRICMMDFELDERQAQEWLRRIRINNVSKVEIWPLRGMPNPFRSLESMKELAEQLKELGIEFLIIDPFSSVYAGDANSNTEVKAFLREIDLFKSQSGVQHLVIAVHAGRNQGQTRGASTLDDHPDALWYLQKAGEKRFFKAVGRDVDVEEAEITFDSSTGEMSFLEFSKKADPLRVMMVSMLNFVQSHPGCSASDLDAGVRGGSTYKSKARKELVKLGAIIETPGPGGAKFYTFGKPPWELLASMSKL